MGNASVFERAYQLWPLLAFLATHRQTITYGVVSQIVGVPAVALGQSRGPIQNYCLKNKLPPLTIVVVNQDTGLPGLGFVAVDTLSASQFAREQARVFDFAWMERTCPSIADFESVGWKNP